jgi:3-methyl-2-oxobutanoate hydroxymethyltransferase
MKVTVPVLHQMKRDGRKIAAVLAADFRTVEILDRSQVDIVLVSDSAGVNLLGHHSAQETTLDDLVLLCRAARRAVRRAFLLADLPFGLSQTSVRDAVRGAIRLKQEGGADGVKVEVGSDTEVVSAIAAAGVPVMAHFGATPRTHARQGGFEGARALLTDEALVEQAKALESAGAFALDLTMGGPATRRVTHAVAIPVLGGRGTTVDSDGQLLQLQRLAGWTTKALDDGVSRYANVAQTILDATNAYVADVRASRLALGRDRE